MAASDLTTTARVIELLGAADNPADANAGAVLDRLVTAMSTFVLNTELRRRSVNGQTSLTDVIDGTGSDRIVLRDWPIIAVASLLVGGLTVQPSPDGVSAGFVFDERRLILLPNTVIGAPLSSSSYIALSKFPRIPQYVSVTYTAGYSATTIPASDTNYNNAPTDLGAAVTFLVAQEYRRRKWIDQKSKTLAQGENVVFRDWEWPPWVNRTFETYRRWWYT